MESPPKSVSTIEYGRIEKLLIYEEMASHYERPFLQKRYAVEQNQMDFVNTTPCYDCLCPDEDHLAGGVLPLSGIVRYAPTYM